MADGYQYRYLAADLLSIEFQARVPGRYVPICPEMCLVRRMCNQPGWCSLHSGPVPGILERGDKMSNQTLIIVIVLVVLLFGGFGFRRWRR
jgi:hypothetical protein